MAATGGPSFNFEAIRDRVYTACADAKEYLQRELPTEFADIVANPKKFFDANRETIITIGGAALATSLLCYLVGMKAFSTFTTALLVVPSLILERSSLPETTISDLCLKIFGLAIDASILGMLSGPVPFALSIYTTCRVFEHVTVISDRSGKTKLPVPRPATSVT